MLPPGLDRLGGHGWQIISVFLGDLRVSGAERLQSPLLQRFLCSPDCAVATYARRPSLVIRKGHHSTLDYVLPTPAGAGGGWVPRLQTGKNLCCGVVGLTISGFIGTPNTMRYYY